MEHLESLIAPASIIPSCPAFEKYRKKESLLSHENIGETNAMEPSLCFAKIAGKVNQ